VLATDVLGLQDQQQGTSNDVDGARPPPAAGR
jgi:hypothetical protein